MSRKKNPRVYKYERVSRQIFTSITPGQARKLRDLANQADHSVSEYVRNLISLHIGEIPPHIVYMQCITCGEHFTTEVAENTEFPTRICGTC